MLRTSSKPSSTTARLTVLIDLPVKLNIGLFATRNSLAVMAAS